MKTPPTKELNAVPELTPEIQPIKNDEVWRPVFGYEGLYEVSTHGRVRNSKGVVLSQRLNKWGYWTVGLWVNNKQSSKRVHRLMAESFLGLSPDEEVDHINSIRSDNSIENLRTCTRSENIHRSLIKGRVKKRKTSKYKGVFYSKSGGKWVANIKKGEEVYVLGSFQDECQAAEEYNKKAKELFGEFAYLNKI